MIEDCENKRLGADLVHFEFTLRILSCTRKYFFSSMRVMRVSQTKNRSWNDDLTASDMLVLQYCCFFKHLVGLGWYLQNSEPSQVVWDCQRNVWQENIILSCWMNLHGSKVHLRPLLYQNTWLWLFCICSLSGGTKLTVIILNFEINTPPKTQATQKLHIRGFASFK